MKILHLADIHIDLIATRLGKFKIVDGENVFYKQRLERFQRLIRFGIDNKVDMIAITGDLFNRPKPFPQEIWDVADILDSIPSHIEVIILPGNHDEITSRGCALQPLKNRRHNINVVLTPTWTHIGDVGFIIAPWGTTIEKMRELRQAHVLINKPVMLTHLGTTLEGKHWTEVAGEVGNVALEDLKALDCAGIMIGHYHGQTDLGQNIWYCGSPECYNFGEADQIKGFLIWHINGGEVKVQPHHLLGEKPWFKTFTVEEFLDYKEIGYAGYVRIQGEANEQQKALILERVQHFHCEDYKLDLQSSAKLTKTFALKGKSNFEILSNYLESKNIPITEALMELDQEIEGEVL